MLTHVRPLCAHDLPLVFDIECRSHSHPWTLRNFEDALSAGYLGLGLWSETSLLAFAWFMRALDEAELLDIAVAPEQRGKRYAQALLAHAYTQLVHTGCVAVHLEVRASNAAARLLYVKQGFDEIGVRLGYYPSGREREDAILMKKTLHAHP